MKLRFCLLMSLLISFSCFANDATAVFKGLTPHYLAVPNGKIEYFRVGQGSPVILISGYASSLAGWNKEFVADLANQHEVILFDNRNVGGTLINGKNYSAKDLANDTDRLIHGLGLKHPTIIGISMGGMIAQQFAVSYPHDISHLVLINTVIAGEHSIPPTIFAANAILHTPQNLVKRYATGIQLLAPPKWWLHMTISLARDHFPGDKLNLTIPETVLNEQRKLILSWARDNQTATKISSIKAPTLVLNGGSDAVIPPGNSEILAQTIPHAQLIRWNEGGHAMIYQYPDQIAEAVNDFLIKT
jgi:pimeloyl-ACP methyl ester carboxylesterase